VAEPALIVLPYLDMLEVLCRAPVVRADLGGDARDGIPGSVHAGLFWWRWGDLPGSMVSGVFVPGLFGCPKLLGYLKLQEGHGGSPLHRSENTQSHGFDRPHNCPPPAIDRLPEL